MKNQGALFSEIEQINSKRDPHGFRYQEDIISEAEEVTLAAALSQLDLKPFEFHGYLGNRRVTNFGLKYNFSSRSVELATDTPPFIADLLERVAEFAGCAPKTFRQVGINEYRPGAGIGWHKDKAEFGIIVGISISASATMRLRRQDRGGWQRASQILRPRSIYILSGEARTEWEHSIPPLNELRYSITFRTLSDRIAVD